MNQMTTTRVRDVVRQVVAEKAPHEVPLIDSLRDFDDDRALRILTRKRQKQEPLGFGYAEAAALITPVVWFVLDQAAHRALDRASDSVLTRGRERMRRLLRRNTATEANVIMVALDPDELTLVRTHILERAAERGIAPAEAEALADSVVARIATLGAAHRYGPRDIPAQPPTSRLPRSPKQPGTAS